MQSPQPLRPTLPGSAPRRWIAGSCSERLWRYTRHMSSAMVVTSDPVPLRTDADGVLRVGSTRVTLDVLVDAFDEGASAEQIAQQYPTLELGDVYAVLAYVIKHRPDVDVYLRNRAGEGSTARAENERRWDPSGVRERLIARSGRA